VGSFCTRTARVLVRATSVTGAISTDASDGVFSIANPGPTIDFNPDLTGFSSSSTLLLSTTAINNQEVRFEDGVTVEISTNEAGTQFFSPTKLKIKKNGRKLLIKGTINDQEIATFWPDNAIRIIRLTNPNC